jgi:hypothetical protein
MDNGADFGFKSSLGYRDVLGYVGTPTASAASFHEKTLPALPGRVLTSN